VQRWHLPESSKRKFCQLRSAYLIEGLGEQALVSVNCRIAGNGAIDRNRISEMPAFEQPTEAGYSVACTEAGPFDMLWWKCKVCQNAATSAVPPIVSDRFGSTAATSHLAG
jgi:hypothetical protein